MGGFRSPRAKTALNLLALGLLAIGLRRVLKVEGSIQSGLQKGPFSRHFLDLYPGLRLTTVEASKVRILYCLEGMFW